jgi:hypothetical protein
VPQFSGSVLVSVQPVLQSVSPAVQTEFVHWPFTQELMEQTMPQPPQLAGSFVRSEHCAPPMRPPRGLPLQRTWGGAQVQVPFTQLSPVAQAFPQEPQLLVSVWVLVQVPPQFCSGDEQVALQLPLTQYCPFPHVLPHDPQLLASVCVLVQLPPQLVSPATQPQTEFSQTPLAQKLPQLPQL